MIIKATNKIEFGLSILAKIIAREEIKNQLTKVNEFTTFPSTVSILNNNVIKDERKTSSLNNNKL